MRAKLPIGIDRRLLGRQGPGAVPDGHRHQPPHQTRGATSSRARSSSSRRRASTTSATSTTCFNDSAFIRDFRETGRADDARLHRAGAAGPGEGAGREARGARHDAREAGAGLAELDAMTPPAQPAQPRRRGSRRALGLPLRQEALVLRLRGVHVASRHDLGVDFAACTCPSSAFRAPVPTQSARPPQANIPQTKARARSDHGDRARLRRARTGRCRRCRSTSCASTPIASSPPPASTRRTATTSASSSTTRRGATRWRRSPTSAGCC